VGTLVDPTEEVVMPLTDSNAFWDSTPDRITTASAEFVRAAHVRGLTCST